MAPRTLAAVAFALAAIAGPAAAPAADPPRPRLVKLPFAFEKAMENTPVVFGGRPLLIANRRDDTKNGTDGYVASMHFYIRDLTTGEETVRFGAGHSFVSALVDGPTLHVWGSRGTNRDWFGSIDHLASTDLKTWKEEPAIEREGGEHLFNCSVCRDGDGWVMAYESNLPVMFCFKFARSRDLSKWEKIPDLIFTGERNEYSACPVIRKVGPWYHVIYLHAGTPGHPGWIPYTARSRDLSEWELSPLNPVIEAGPGEGCNNSDIDLFEWEGNTYLFYATGDQQTWGAVRVALFAGPMKAFHESWFPEGFPGPKASARRPK